MEKGLLLIDGNSVACRAYYATCYKEVNIKDAVTAFHHMIIKALNKLKPDYCVVAFDKNRNTFRKGLNPSYKENRNTSPEELKIAISKMKELLDAMNIKRVEIDSYEADDIIGTLSSRFNGRVAILSSDRDLLQLVDKKTKVFLMKSGISEMIKVDEEAVSKMFNGLKPKQIIDYKALAGDKSDGILGVKGIGPKNAISLLNEYKTCEKIYGHLDELKPNIKKAMEDGRNDCVMSKFLTTILLDIEIDIDIEECFAVYNKKAADDYIENL